MVELPEFASWATQQTFNPFVGGFLEVTNPYQSYIYYGKVAAITLTDNGELTVNYEWCGVGVDKFNRRSRDYEGGWVRADEPYSHWLYTLPSDEVPNDYVRVFFKLLNKDEDMLRIFGGPILEDMLTFYRPGTFPRITQEDIHPADPARPVEKLPNYISGPPGGGGATMWEVRPDGRQVQKKFP